MSLLDFGVGGPPVSDVLIVKQREGFDRNLVQLARKATDAGASGQLIEAAHAIFWGKEPNEYGLHDRISLVLNNNINAVAGQA